MEKHELYIPVDIEKSIGESEDGTRWFVRGFASTPDKDTHNEIIDPSGIKLDYFKQHGYINYEHSREDRIGVPVNCYVDATKGMFLEAILFKDHPLAQKIWALAEDIKKTGIQRSLGFSVEGKARRGSGSRADTFEELMVTNVALTAQPANPNATWESFVKSINNMQTLAEEDYGKSISVVANSLVTLSDLYKADSGSLYGKVEDALKHLEGIERSTRETDILALQIVKGLSRKEAEDIVKAIREENK